MGAATLGVVLAACNQTGNQTADIDVANNEDHKIAYTYGVYTAMNMESQSFNEVNQDAFVQGVMDKLNGKELKVSEDSVMSILQVFYQKQMDAAAEKEKEKGEAFLAENKNKEGIQVTESGLQYEVLVEGDGASPTIDDTIKAHYHGTLIDGTVFDSSVERDQPATFPVSGVISGWTEALQMMKVGSKWKIYLPSDLAYGKRGAGEKIKPNAALIFEVELLEIVDNANAQ